MKHYCPVCSWGEAAPYLKNSEVELVRCTQCTLIRRQPLPRLSELDAMGEAQEPDEAAAAAQKFRGEVVVQNVRNFVPSGKWLDVGCGDGARLVAAREAGYDVQGVEFDPALAQHARGKWGLEITDGNIWDAHLPAASFNIVTLWRELEYTPAPLDLLAEIQRVLKPGGHCLIEVRNIVAERNLADEKQLEKSLAEPQRALYFSPVTARAVVEKAGYAIREMQTRSTADYEARLPAWKKAAKGVLKRVGLPELIGVVAQK